jgi:hypothetical protein
VSTELAAGEWRTVDFGSPERAGEWTGRVLLPRGKALDIGAMRLDIESGASTEEANVLPSGEFRARLSAGVHRVRLRTGQGNTVAFAPVTMPQGDLEQDLVLPPAVLRVRVTREGAPTNDVHLWLASASGSRVRGEWGTDGGILFLGVAPGDYKLTCSPPIRGAVGGQLPVRIGPTDDEVELDVVVGGP